MRLFLITLGLLAFATQNATAQISVIELFTTSACPACHPADALLNNLQSENPNQNFIALSCHTTAMGDASIDQNLALKQCSDRQSFYYQNETLNTASTPSAIMNGLHHVTASKEKMMRSALAMVNSTTTIQPITFNTTQTEITASFPTIGLKNNQIPQIWVFSSLKTHQAELKDGVTLHYAGLVKDTKKITDWNGTATTLQLKTKNLKGNTLTILAQYPSGEIIAAGQTSTTPSSH